jgi:hypothetical protein
MLDSVMNGDFGALAALLNKPEPRAGGRFSQRPLRRIPRTADILAKGNSVTAIKALFRNPWSGSDGIESGLATIRP